MNELKDIASEVWASMANTYLEPAGVIAGPESSTGSVTSSVRVEGAWEGAVRLDMNMDMARTTTARLLGAEEADISPEDIQDAVGELANMLGGGVKELMPQPCKLSPPSVSLGDERKCAILSGRITSECSFTADSGLLRVSVVERDS